MTDSPDLLLDRAAASVTILFNLSDLEKDACITLAPARACLVHLAHYLNEQGMLEVLQHYAAAARKALEEDDKSKETEWVM
ncbi:hypothetical protein [Terriglobus aquaticus]|uniref:Uncharacterized protein n=1 Tax=Terriglobus aquaticus TaxID=940139 RepID=A0ABW9KLI9_9BACT|nr:hypothetical protein [Terriglobus aquaticus]